MMNTLKDEKHVLVVITSNTEMIHIVTINESAIHLKQTHKDTRREFPL